MFIELTDHLKCPAPHAEQFLVLLPEAMEGRRVVRGQVGCPVCGKLVQLQDGVLDFGAEEGAEPAVASEEDGGGPSTPLSAEAALALLGIEGPGGYLLLVDRAAMLATDLETLLPGVGLVLLNPPVSLLPGGSHPGSTVVSLIRSPRMPIKASSMRGAVIGGEAARDPVWITDAGQAVLPGLRVVVTGPVPPEMPFEILAQTPGCWVGRRL